jgi:protein-tyrosine sulfotransferase
MITRERQRANLILGFPRSGTTLLARLLDAHPQVSCPPETYLFASAARFLHEQSRVEGPPIGVLAGLVFLGIPAEDVAVPL